MDMGVGLNHVVELKFQRPALLTFNQGAKKIPYDGKEPSKIAVSDLETGKDIPAELGKTAAEWLRSDWTKSRISQWWRVRTWLRS